MKRRGDSLKQSCPVGRSSHQEAVWRREPSEGRVAGAGWRWGPARSYGSSQAILGLRVFFWGKREAPGGLWIGESCAEHSK